MTKLIHRHFLRHADLIILNGCSATTAAREMAFLRSVLGKKKIKTPNGIKSPFKVMYQKVSITEYCEIQDLYEPEIRERIGA